jgi:Rrf2 family nitric oxide-sensitive transcriptional repressor
MKMQLHITTDYAMRILIYLTEKKAIIPSSELAEQLNIPHNYVQSLGRKMKKLNLVDTVLGPLGGFFLTRDPDEVTLTRINRKR